MSVTDSAPTLANRGVSTIEELEEARHRVLGEQEIYRAYEAAFYEAVPTDPSDDPTRLKAGLGRFLLGQESRALELLLHQKDELAAFVRAKIWLGRGDAQQAQKEIADVVAKRPDSL